MATPAAAAEGWAGEEPLLQLQTALMANDRPAVARLVQADSGLVARDPHVLRLAVDEDTVWSLLGVSLPASNVTVLAQGTRTAHVGQTAGKDSSLPIMWNVIPMFKK